MQTLADFKRLPVGTKLLTVQGLDRYVGTVREITHKQSNAIKLQGGSWLEYPKASEVTITPGGIRYQTLQTGQYKHHETK